jgi:hypothetical protein
MHPYLYATGDPVNNRDPSGRGDEALTYSMGAGAAGATISAVGSTTPVVYSSVAWFGSTAVDVITYSVIATSTVAVAVLAREIKCQIETVGSAFALAMNGAGGASVDSSGNVQCSKSICPISFAPHKGQNERHDACADRETNNVFGRGKGLPRCEPRGCDAVVGGFPFDSMDRNGMLYEVKVKDTTNYGGNPEFIQERSVVNDLPELFEEYTVAKYCQMPFTIAAADELYLEILMRHWPPMFTQVHFMLVKQCLE